MNYDDYHQTGLTKELREQDYISVIYVLLLTFGPGLSRSNLGVLMTENMEQRHLPSMSAGRYKGAFCTGILEKGWHLRP
jgi:hypothetical protein